MRGKEMGGSSPKPEEILAQIKEAKPYKIEGDRRVILNPNPQANLIGKYIDSLDFEVYDKNVNLLP